METFGNNALAFLEKLSIPRAVPNNIEVLNPTADESVMGYVKQFYHRFYNDTNPRVFFVGINPGRMGAGVTGVQFTDPVQLQESCQIPNDLKKSAELSSTFVYDVVKAMGGASEFFSKVYLTSAYPFGFVQDGKNLNYYDVPALQSALEPSMIDYLKHQQSFGCYKNTIVSMGNGKNYKVLKKLNDKYKVFDQVLAVPHPRWVMQYRLKRKQEFIDQYLAVIDQLTA